MTDSYPGGRVDKSDPRYETLIRGFNLRWVGKPKYIEVCGDAEQVRRTVQQAVDEKLRVTVRSGGHCYENFAVGNDGGVIVDMAPMSRVYYDAERKAYCIEAGATLWNAIWNLYKEYGKAIPGGSCYSVGAGGHITGGYGLLSRNSRCSSISMGRSSVSTAPSILLTTDSSRCSTSRIRPHRSSCSPRSTLATSRSGWTNLSRT